MVGVIGGALSVPKTSDDMGTVEETSDAEVEAEVGAEVNFGITVERTFVTVIIEVFVALLGPVTGDVEFLICTRARDTSKEGSV